MKTFDIIVLGSGFTSLGIASKVKNTLIIEKEECLDRNFYLSLKSYKHVPHTATLSGATRLQEIFNQLAIFNGDLQNVNGFDVALCNYAKEIGAKILLRTVVLSVENLPSGYAVTVYNNGGIKRYTAKKVIDTRSEKLNPFYTVLFSANDSDIKIIEKAFNGKIEKAFYNGWYALKFSANGFNENDIKIYVYHKFNEISTTAKILHMPPSFSYSSLNPFCDNYYQNPLKAFEFGESI